MEVVSSVSRWLPADERREGREAADSRRPLARAVLPGSVTWPGIRSLVGCPDVPEDECACRGAAEGCRKETDGSEKAPLSPAGCIPGGNQAPKASPSSRPGREEGLAGRQGLQGPILILLGPNGCPPDGYSSDTTSYTQRGWGTPRCLNTALASQKPPRLQGRLEDKTESEEPGQVSLKPRASLHQS